MKFQWTFQVVSSSYDASVLTDLPPLLRTSFLLGCNDH